MQSRRSTLKIERHWIYLAMAILFCCGCRREESGFGGQVTLDSHPVEAGRIELIGKESNLYYDTKIAAGRYKLASPVAEGDYVVRIEITQSHDNSKQKCELEISIAADASTKDFEVAEFKLVE